MRLIEKKVIGRIRAGSYGSKQLRELLCEAASKGWVDVARELIARGVDPNSRQFNRSALTLAAQLGHDHVEVIRLLLESGAKARDPDAIAECGVESLPVLLDAGAKLDGDAKGRNPLLVAIIQRTKQDKALALIAAGANPNVADDKQTTALMHAALLGRDRVFAALLAAGADLYAVDSTGRTALRYALETLCESTAATESDMRAAKRIVKQMRDRLPAQPEDVVLLDIVLGEHASLADRLHRGLDANQVVSGSIGFLGLSLETLCSTLEEQKGSASILDVLAILSPTAVDSVSGGSTLLMWAVAARQHECIKTLLSHGADPEKMNDDGVSAFTLSNSRRFDVKTRELIRTAVDSA